MHSDKCIKNIIKKNTYGKLRNFQKCNLKAKSKINTLMPSVYVLKLIESVLNIMLRRLTNFYFKIKIVSMNLI